MHMVSAVAGPWSTLAGWVVSLFCINGLGIHCFHLVEVLFLDLYTVLQNG